MISTTDSSRHAGPVFIVGVGRSGTSLVQSVLASHDALAFPPETGFLRKYVAGRVLQQEVAARGRAGAAALLEADQRFSRTGLDAAALMREIDSVTDSAVYRLMLFRFANGEGKPLFGDKDPRAIECLPVLAETLPTCRVIHVIRDPRDVLVSKKRASWSRNRSVLRHILASRIQLKIGVEEGSSLFGPDYYELRYESFLEDPHGQLRSLCAFLGLEFQPRMLNFGAAAKKLVSNEEMPWKRETLGPLLRHNSGNWRRHLSSWEIALTETACHRNFAVGGYEKTHVHRHLPPATRVALWLPRTAIAFADIAYRAYRKLTSCGSPRRT